MRETDVDPDPAHDLLLGEGFVGAGDLGLGSVPTSAVVADYKRKIRIKRMWDFLDDSALQQAAS